MRFSSACYHRIIAEWCCDALLIRQSHSVYESVFTEPRETCRQWVAALIFSFKHEETARQRLDQTEKNKSGRFYCITLKFYFTDVMNHNISKNLSFSVMRKLCPAHPAATRIKQLGFISHAVEPENKHIEIWIIFQTKVSQAWPAHIIWFGNHQMRVAETLKSHIRQTEIIWDQTRPNLSGQNIIL